MAELTALTTLADEVGVKNERFLAALTRRGVDPVHTMKSGKGIVRLYDRDSALEAWRAEHPERTAPAVQDEASPSILTDILDIATRVKELQDQDHAEIGDALDALRTQSARLGEQNVLIMRAIERTSEFALRTSEPLTKLSQQMADLTVAFDAWADIQGEAPKPPAGSALPVLNLPQREDLPAAQPKAAEPVAVEKEAKMRVAVIGLKNDQANMIEREFKEVFDLRFHRSEDAKGRHFHSGLHSCDVVLAMTGFIDHGIDATIRASGKRLIRVSGGMSSLRDKLTELFISTEEAKK